MYYIIVINMYLEEYMLLVLVIKLMGCIKL